MAIGNKFGAGEAAFGIHVDWCVSDAWSFRCVGNPSTARACDFVPQAGWRWLEDFVSGQDVLWRTS